MCVSRSFSFLLRLSVSGRWQRQAFMWPDSRAVSLSLISVGGGVSHRWHELTSRESLARFIRPVTLLIKNNTLTRRSESAASSKMCVFAVVDTVLESLGRAFGVYLKHEMYTGSVKAHYRSIDINDNPPAKFSGLLSVTWVSWAPQRRSHLLIYSSSAGLFGYFINVRCTSLF